MSLLARLFIHKMKAEVRQHSPWARHLPQAGQALAESEWSPFRMGAVRQVGDREPGSPGACDNPGLSVADLSSLPFSSSVSNRNLLGFSLWLLPLPLY